MAVSRSPFPGMDPWLERYWEAIHHTYVSKLREQIVGQLPDGLFSEVEETVYIRGGEQTRQARVRPDVGVLGTGTGAPDDGWFPDDRGGTAVATPVRIPLADDPVALTHVAIRSLAGGEPLVTAVEVISPTNKNDTRARRQYLRQRRAYVDAHANVVEIDLLRGGRPLIGVPWDMVAADLLTPYRAAVRRAADPDVAEVDAEYYPIPLRDRLPTIRLPLRAGDDDLPLDLQRPIDAAYEAGLYANRIDYARPPDPPLSPADAAWAAELVAAAAARR